MLEGEYNPKKDIVFSTYIFCRAIRQIVDLLDGPEPLTKKELARRSGLKIGLISTAIKQLRACHVVERRGIRYTANGRSWVLEFLDESGEPRRVS